jgi:hypothetical protein
MEPISFNPFLPEFNNDPYPTYERLRSEDPIHWSFLDMWVLTRYRDVKAVLCDPRFRSNPVPKRVKEKGKYLQHQQKPKNLDSLAQTSSKFIGFLDPPDHTRLRELFSKAWSFRLGEGLHSEIQEIVDELIDNIRNKGVMDIISDFASPLPVILAGRILGVPDESYEKLHQWSNDLSLLFEPLVSLDEYEYLNQVSLEFTDYFRDLILERQNNPKDDLISTLISAKNQGRKLNEEDLLSLCMMVIVTATGTSQSFLGNSMLALLNHPDQLEKLKREPSIIQSAVEELLRYDSPVQQTFRIATEDVEISGQKIQAGQMVLVSLGAANRDPSKFSDPDRLKLTRRENKHLAFADGIHHCLGAYLSRVEGQIAINTLIQNLPEMKRVEKKTEWRKNMTLRMMKTLPVTFTL